MCWYENVRERIVEKKVGLQRLNLIAIIGVMYYVDCRLSSFDFDGTILSWSSFELEEPIRNLDSVKI